MPDQHKQEEVKMKVCSGCGERVPEGTVHPTVPRVVRANHIFMGKRGGETVQVEPRYLGTKSVANATVSISEENERIAAAALPPVPVGKTSVEMAAEFSQAIRESYERDRERERQQRERGLEPDPRRRV